MSLIKTGAKIIGRSAGDTRAPLSMTTAEETKKLEELIQRAAQLLG